MRAASILPGLITALSACGTAAPPATATFHADIRPVIESRCVDCHQPGGVAPLDFTDPAAWSEGPPPWAAAAAAAVAAGTMPPWMPDDACHPIEDARGLSEAQRAAFADWAASDFALGEASAYVPPQVPARPMVDRKATWGEADLELAAPEPYPIRSANPDDYRCIVLDHDFPVDTWIRGIEIRPDQKAWVHHLILYQFEASQVPSLLAEDAETPDEIGYPCFNNPDAETLMAWAPGQNGEFLPEGIARYVPAGAKWVIQVHYNTLGANPADVPSDQTSVAIWESPSAPSQALLTIPFPNMNIRIPAGNRNVVEKDTFSVGRTFGTLPFDLPVIGTMGHMHQLGTAISLEARDDSGRTCLLDIPRWDFNWQQTYYYPEDAWYLANSSTELHMTCRYDNSAANQIVVNGEALEPRDVTWGENTTDEMCLTYILALLPAAVISGL